MRALETRLGGSGFTAEGAFDLGERSRGLHVHDVLLDAAELELLLGGFPLAAGLRGEADLSCDGKVARAQVQVKTERGGQIDSTATSDAGRAAAPERAAGNRARRPGVPSAKVRRGALRLELRGGGLPKFDERGLDGDVRGTLQLGPRR